MASLTPFPFTPDSAIQNNPFYSPLASVFQTPQGPLIFGAGFQVNYATGVVGIDPAPPASLGTVTSVTAGFGVVTNPFAGITTTGQIGLSTVSGLVPGSYSYAALSVDAYGRVTTISNGATPVQTVTGNYPISVTGLAPSLTVSIAAASTTNFGAVQLVDNLSTPSDSLALTARQGTVLQQQIDALAATSAIQFLAGTFNASTPALVTVTAAGAGAGLTSGSDLPAASATNAGSVVIISTGATYTPPGGTAVALVPGDQLLSTGSAWVPFLTGFRAPYATTTTAGIVRYATIVETQALANSTIAVTPFGLSGMIASTTQQGFVELATTAETLALADTTRAVTPSGLGNLQATTTTRGLVQLDDTLTSTSTTTAPTANALKTAYDASIHKDIIQANGDLIVGFTASDPRILTKGIDGQVLTVDDTASLGLSWQTPVFPQGTPVGAMCWFTTNDNTKLPVGWLIADGASYTDASAGDYYELFQVIGTTFTPPADPPGTFRVPDLRGQFVRGWNDAGGTPGTYDVGRGFGTCQVDAFKQHNHSVTDPGHIHGITDPGHDHNVTDPGHNHSITDPGHFHGWSVPNAEVVGDEPGFYDGNNKVGNQDKISNNNFTGISINNCTTGVTINNNTTGITATLVCTTALTVDNSPALAPSPNETRPVNLSLLPIIKYKNP